LGGGGGGGGGWWHNGGLNAIHRLILSSYLYFSGHPRPISTIWEYLLPINWPPHVLGVLYIIIPYKCKSMDDARSIGTRCVDLAFAGGIL